jgi:PilZ domain
MSKISSSEQRKHLRIGLIVDIELTLPGQDNITVRTKNISDGGLFLVLDNVELPPMGTEVQVRLKNQLGDGDEPPVNRAMVVRAESNGIGLEFME